MPNNIERQTIVEWLMFLVLISGAANWALIGILGIDLIDLFFGHLSFFARLSYLAFGVAGAYTVLQVAKRLHHQTRHRQADHRLLVRSSPPPA